MGQMTEAARIAEYLAIIPAALLAAAAQGRLDLNKLAVEELAARGMNKAGVWVGFAAAKQQAAA